MSKVVNQLILSHIPDADYRKKYEIMYLLNIHYFYEK
jgi:hypothetical protein